MIIEQICKVAKENASYCAHLSTATKNEMLKIISDALINSEAAILAANDVDLKAAEEVNMASHMQDRLRLTTARINGMAKGVSDLISLPDPIGMVLESWTNYVGLLISRVSVPLGVVGIIYEARPNVTSDTVALCIKTGNAIVLRGSKDAINSNIAIVRIIKNSLTAAGYNAEFIQLIEDTTRDGVQTFLKCNGYLDVLVPRGSAALIRNVKENSTVPVIETGSGNCHAYIEKTADYDIAKNIIMNGKLQRPSVCNALESIIVDKELCGEFLAKLLGELLSQGVTIYADEQAKAVFQAAESATSDDFAKEYLGLQISVKVVDGVLEAIEHINKYSTHHSEVIITNDAAAAEQFLNFIDSAAVYVNASTRFTDGEQFGFGAELGISTQKLHVRGPIGPLQLTSYKYHVIGDGQTRK